MGIAQQLGAVDTDETVVSKAFLLLSPQILEV